MHEVVSALAEKYRELVALRTSSKRDVGPRLKALAARFPGALRELDEQPLEALRERLAALETARAGRAVAPAWAAWVGSYHAWLRVALRLRRGRPRAPARRTETAAEALRAYAPEAPGDPHALTLDDVAEMLAPPRGRLVPWALARAARAHDVPEDEVARVLFARRA